MVRIDRAFVLLDATLAAKAALRRLSLRRDARWVVIRRASWARVHWYTFGTEEARGRLEAVAPATTVERAFNLHETDAARLHPREGLERAETQPGDLVMASPGAPAGVVRQLLTRARPPGPREPPTGRLPTARGPPPVGAEPEPAGAEPPAPPKPGATRGRGTGGRAPAADLAPFHAWPDLQAPPHVEEGRTFWLEVGFAAAPVAGVVAEEVVIGEAPKAFDLDLQVRAPGFSSAKGWRHTLRVRRDRPTEARLRLELTAEPGPWAGDEGTRQRVLGVSFTWRGELCGLAQRAIVVVRAGAALEPPAAGDAGAFAAQVPGGAPLRIGGPTAAPDLTVLLARTDGNTARSNFTWSFESRHDVTLPDPVARDMEDDPATFASELSEELVEVADKAPEGLGRHLRGLGLKLADRVPPALWKALAAVAPKVTPPGAPPTVLLLTEEWAIPWELAWMPRPLDRKADGFLGAQVDLGRWLHGDEVASARPETEVVVERMVVLYGDYPEGAGALPEAIQEKDGLVERERAVPVPLVDAEVGEVLDGRRPSGGGQLLHFACHGVGNAEEPGATRLVLQSGAPLTEEMLRGALVGPKAHPFLFLNACQAGTAGGELGMAGGFVGAALRSEFRGCVGALWSISSATAREVAEAFYRLTLDEGVPVASALRQLRGRFRADAAGRVDDTWLAYVFYGHPALRLKRTGRPR